MKSIILSTLFVITLFWLPSSVTAQSCDCSADLLNCSDFASPANAQECFWYCGSQQVGDIHRLDSDLNGVACDVLAVEPMPVATPIPTVVEPVPTAVPAYEVCACGGDYYDCSTFSSPSHAQGCYDYCAAQGLGDVHQMDPDGDGLACLVSGAASLVSVVPTVYVAPTLVPAATPYVPPTAIPTLAPTATSVPYVPPTAVPMMSVAPTPTPYIPPMPEVVLEPFIGIVSDPASCTCDYDRYNCSNFDNQDDSQACFWNCGNSGFGDIHRLDQGGVEGLTCENYFDSWSPPLTFDVVDTSSSATCDCSGDVYNCSSFATQAEAQGCFDYCSRSGYGDIHRLDRNNDAYACESLPN